MAKPVITKITINLASQTCVAEADGKVFYRCACVTGDRDNPTKKGEHVIYRKHEDYTSKLYGVPMDYAMFFYKGQAIHKYHGLPYGVPWSAVRIGRSFSDQVGSHGCVRLQESDAKKLFRHSVRNFTRVVVV